MFKENRKRWRNEGADLDLFWERTYADTPSDAQQQGSGSGGGGGGSQGASQSGTGDEPTIYKPIAGGPETGSAYGMRDGRMHNGVDIPCPIGTGCFAPVDGKILYASTGGFSDGGMIHFEFKEDLGSIKQGDVIGWGHVYQTFFEAGEEVTGGQKIATSGHQAPHVHFVYLPGGNNGGSQIDGTADPTNVYNRLRQGQAPTDDGTSGGGGAGGANGESLAKAGAFATFFQLSSGLDRVLSLVLDQEKSLMNDKPLLPFVQQLTEASLRSFQSMPNGNFFAFYPDYFGGMGHRKPYWEIKDIEIIDGKIDLSDDQLATHVYVVGSTLGSMQLSTGFNEQLVSSGVVTVFNAFMVDFLNGPEAFAPQGEAFPEQGNEEDRKKYRERLEKWRKKQPNLANKDNAIKFLEKYGARPNYEEMPMVRSPYYELFLAYQRFCMLWSQQFATTFQLTYMPELFPGGIIKLVDHGIQCYVESVTHNCSYTSGFTTNVVLSSPAAIEGSDQTNVNQGLIREGVLNR